MVLAANVPCCKDYQISTNCLRIRIHKHTDSGTSDGKWCLLPNRTEDRSLAVLCDVMGHLKVPKGTCRQKKVHTVTRSISCLTLPVPWHGTPFPTPQTVPARLA